MLRQDWAGALRDYRGQYTSPELQKKLWNGEEIETKYGLDFDDGYQYVAAQVSNLEIVSFDGDFDRTGSFRFPPPPPTPNFGGVAKVAQASRRAKITLARKDSDQIY